MIVSLNQEAKQQLKLTAQRAKMNPETYIKGLLEQLFKPNSMYMILNPIPTPERLNALKVALEGILNMPEFYGFRFLTKDESTQETAVHSKFAWCGNCADVREVLFEGFVQEFSKGGFVGGDLVCQSCKSITVTLYRPKTLLEISAECTTHQNESQEIAASTAPLSEGKKETPDERLRRVLNFPKPAEELLLYDYWKLPIGEAPDGAWEMESTDGDTNMWRRLHECQTKKDVRCDVCGRVG
jgi:hypothetical protein